MCISLYIQKIFNFPLNILANPFTNPFSWRNIKNVLYDPYNVDLDIPPKALF
uniref:Uncharacterized protein n=1 Tax=Rhizophora mucronata TaxID=61149 RepID=A0A2P2Q796_RHIMU